MGLIKSLIITVAFVYPVAASATTRIQIAELIIYGVMLDSHCGTHDASAITQKLLQDRIDPPFLKEETDEAMNTVYSQFFNSGQEKFCIYVKHFFRNIFGKDVS